jgi:isoleucyl-tRNA synthetase
MEVGLTDEVRSAGDFELQLVPAVLGPRVGADVQKIIKAVRSGDWERGAGAEVTVLGRTLADDEYTLRLAPKDAETTRALPGIAGLVSLDLVVTPELEAEGLARDVVRLVQQARKEEGLHVSDRIHLVLDLPDDAAAAVAAHKPWVLEQTLAPELVLAGPISDGRRGELVDGRAVHIGLSRVSST